MQATECSQRLDLVELSQRFSRPSVDKFAGVAFSEGIGGVPVIVCCAATIECTVADEHVVGDHVLFLGCVNRYAHEEAAPLLFLNGRYTRGADLQSARH